MIMIAIISVRRNEQGHPHGTYDAYCCMWSMLGLPSVVFLLSCVSYLFFFL